MTTFQEAKRDIQQSLKQPLVDLLHGAADDLVKYANDVTDGLLLAIELGREDLAEEKLDQLQAIAEVHRIRALRVGWDTVRSIMESLVSVGVRTLLVEAPKNE